VTSWGITEIQIGVIDAILSVFETGKTGEYSAIATIPGDTGGLSYGKHQASLTSGNLHGMIARYCDDPEAQYAEELRPYLEAMKKQERRLDADSKLRSLLTRAASDRAMHRAQDGYFADKFMNRALTAWKGYGFKSALSAAVIYDSFIHGSFDMIVQRTNARFAAPTPENEQDWIRNYIAARKEWLSTHARPDLRNTAIRTIAMEKLVEAGNWDLNLPLPIERPKGSQYPLTVYDLGAHLFANAIRRTDATGFGVAAKGEYPGATARTRFVQESLQLVGFPCGGPPDGSYGPATIKAVKEFQKSCDLPQTGAVDGATFEALCGEREEREASPNAYRPPDDLGLVDLPPEKKERTSAALATTGAAAGVGAVAAGTAGSIYAGDRTDGAEPDGATTPAGETVAAPAPAAAPVPPSAEARPPGDVTLAPADPTGAPATDPASVIVSPAPVPGDAGDQTLPAAAPQVDAPVMESAAAMQGLGPIQSGQTMAETKAEMVSEQPVVSLMGIEVDVGALTWAAAGLFLASVILVALARRRAY